MDGIFPKNKRHQSKHSSSKGEKPLYLNHLLCYLMLLFIYFDKLIQQLSHVRHIKKKTKGISTEKKHVSQTLRSTNNEHLYMFISHVMWTRSRKNQSWKHLKGVITKIYFSLCHPWIYQIKIFSFDLVIQQHIRNTNYLGSYKIPIFCVLSKVLRKKNRFAKNKLFILPIELFLYWHRGSNI